MKKMLLLAISITAVLTAMVLAGCSGDEGVEADKSPIPNGDGQSPEMPADTPSISLTAVVVSLLPDTNTACQGTCPGDVYPKDSGVIRIETITEMDSSVNWEEIGIAVGNEVTVEFLYSSRPAIIRRIPEPSGSDMDKGNATVSTGVSVFAKPIPVENAYFVFEFPTTSVAEETETILPGLKEGDRFAATIYHSLFTLRIDEYKIVT